VEVRTEHTRGSIARPLTDDELQDKVQALVTPVLGDGAADRIRKAVDGLPGAPDTSVLLAALRPSTPTSIQDSADTGPGATGDVTDPETTTDRLLALAGQPASTLPAVTALARFTAAVTTEQGIATARTLLRALHLLAAQASAPAQAGRLVEADDRSPAQAGQLLDADHPPIGPAARLADDGVSPPVQAGQPPDASDRPAGSAGHLVRAALPAGPALTAWVTGAAAAAAPAPDDPTVAMVVCAAARALGDDCLAAVAAGLEAAAVVESGLDGVAGPGWSVPTVAAGIGAGVAAGLMLGLPEAELRNALGVCATQAAGLRAAADTDAGPLQAGKAAFNAVEAALLARAGFTGAAEPLDGRRGLFALFGRG
jgi:hypothetical protein